MSTTPVDIQIPNIEKELSAASPGSSKEVSVGRLSKACLFTLVIYAHEERRVNYLQELVDTILDKFPCRILFIQGNTQSSTSYFHVTVSKGFSGRSTPATGAAVACDQITIKASKDQLFRVPFLILPYIVPDLPMYLLWGQNPFEEKDIFPHLQPYAARVIFDSECSDNIELFCKEMEESLNTLKTEIMDISWALVSNWRDMLHQLFDTEEKVKQLQYLKSIVIEYNGTKTCTLKHPEIRALYLQAWLACCLQWQYHDTERFEDSAVISYIGPIHPVVIALSPKEIQDLPPGAIQSIELTMSDGHSYFIARKPNLSQVVVHASTAETCALPFTLPLPNVHRGLSFLREIFFSKLGMRYQEMLHVIAEINTKIFTSR